MENEFLHRQRKSLAESELTEFYQLQRTVDENKVTEALEKKNRDLENLEVQLQACMEQIEMEKEKLKMVIIF